jgi:hypothetical protein
MVLQSEPKHELALANGKIMSQRQVLPSELIINAERDLQAYAHTRTRQTLMLQGQVEALETCTAAVADARAEKKQI